MNAMFQRALLVEDEGNLAVALGIALEKLGIQVCQASTLSLAREVLATDVAPELVLLDRQLPDGEGLDLCRELRERGYSGTILVLTAAGQVEERVEGLNTGADDYLSKPFSWQELEARIKALARRRPMQASLQTTPHAASRAGARAETAARWTVDEARLRILGPKGWIELTPLEFKLASKLISAAGAILSRKELLQEVWGFKFLPQTRTVDHFLGRLRKHFELDPEDPRHFLTVRGAGYRFVP